MCIRPRSATFNALLTASPHHCAVHSYMDWGFFMHTMYYVLCVETLSETNVYYITDTNNALPCLRPYHVENTGSRPITEVKQRWARSVLGWVTAWEYRVP